MLYDESASFVRPFVSTMLDFVPIVGNVKSAAELGLGRDYIGGQDIGYGERALRTAAVIFPYVKHLKFVRTILWPVKFLANKTGKKLKNLKDKASAILKPLAINAARPGFIELGGEAGHIATKEAAEKIAAAFKGATLKGAQAKRDGRV